MTVTILLVEDDGIDRRAFRRDLSKFGVENKVVDATNGLEALEILEGRHPNKKIEKPFIILIDINMPGMNGHEFLSSLRGKPDLSDSIVFVLTTSNNTRDKLKAYKERIAGYILKNRAGENQAGACELLSHYLLTVKFPGEAND